MKKKLTTAFIGATLVMAASAMATESTDEFAFVSKSLVGIEGGYTTFDVERNEPGQSADVKTYDQGEVGLKIGAQGENYRAFLSARYYDVSGYDYFVTYGAELQYMFNFSKMANFFIGANFGMMDGRFDVNEAETRTISDPYYGGDAGFNIHLNKTYDLELGARFMASDAENTKNSITYQFDHLVTGYASLIVKFDID